MLLHNKRPLSTQCDLKYGLKHQPNPSAELWVETIGSKKHKWSQRACPAQKHKPQLGQSRGILLSNTHEAVESSQSVLEGNNPSERD